MALSDFSESFKKIAGAHLVAILEGKAKTFDLSALEQKQLQTAFNIGLVESSPITLKPMQGPINVDVEDPIASLASLEAIKAVLQRDITDTVKRNMGTGDRRDILNLRTGRFAESVTIDKLTESRQGMISIFYNYMKYPYQTFQPGFKQGSPPSRDPKILITKSIKEIAIKLVTNRLRSVLV